MNAKLPKNVIIVVTGNSSYNQKQIQNLIFNLKKNMFKVKIIAIEQGILSCLNNKLKIDIACGDFDSFSAFTKKQILHVLNSINCKTFIFPEEKDYSDFEMCFLKFSTLFNNAAFTYVVYHQKDIYHLLSQFFFLRKYKQTNMIFAGKREFFFQIPSNTFWELNQNQYLSILTNNKLTKFSLFNFDETFLTINNAKYSLKNQKINRLETWLISNIAAKELKIYSATSEIIFVAHL